MPIKTEEITFNSPAAAFEFIYKSKSPSEVIRLCNEALSSYKTTVSTKTQAAYWCARASQDIGLFVNAEEFYLTSITFSPDWWKPIKGLFNLYLNTGRFKDARLLIEDINRDYISEFLINNLRFELSKRTGEAITLFDYSVSLTFDSNVNQGIEADKISYFGLLFETDPESKPKSSIGYNLKANYRSSWLISDKRLIGISFIADTTDFKSFIGDNASARIQFNLNEADEWAGKINIGSKWYNHEKLFDFLSFDFVINKKLRSGSNFFITPQLGSYKYKNLDIYSGRFITTALGYQFFNKNIPYSFMKISKYKANDPVFSFKEFGLGFNLKYSFIIIENTNLYFTDREYKLRMIEFNNKRKDLIQRVEVNFKHAEILDRDIKFKLIYEKNDSNIRIFTRDRWALEWYFNA